MSILILGCLLADILVWYPSWGVSGSIVSYKVQESADQCKQCRNVVKSGGATYISDYILLVVPYTSRGVWGHAPQKNFGIFVL